MVYGQGPEPYIYTPIYMSMPEPLTKPGPQELSQGRQHPLETGRETLNIEAIHA